ncbi:zinc finger BED domain-containing protein RICESLEEPER 2-like protein [Tanacetum coccineum]
MCPILSRMAQDMLSVQATSVAFESAFQLILEEEVLEHEAIALSDEEIALDKADSEASPTDPKEKMLI